MTHIRGSNLKAGDTIEVWWSPKRDLITALRPYKGPLEHLFPAGARIAEFAILKSGMTIDNSDFYDRIDPETKP